MAFTPVAMISVIRRLLKGQEVIINLIVSFVLISRGSMGRPKPSST